MLPSSTVEPFPMNGDPLRKEDPLCSFPTCSKLYKNVCAPFLDQLFTVKKAGTLKSASSTEKKSVLPVLELFHILTGDISNFV